MPFFAAVAARSTAHADKPLLIAPDGATLTHGAALRRAAQMARVLQELGLRPGDRVAVKAEKSFDAVLLYLACLQSGLVYVPMNPGLRAEETAHILTDAIPALVLCAPEQEATFGGMRAIALQDLARQSEASDPALSRPGAGPCLAVILYTSGTTGRPKGALLSQANILANGTALSQFWRFTPDDVTLHVVPLFHSHGLFVSLSCTLLSGSALLLTPSFSAEQAVALLPACTVFMGVPTMYARMLACPALERAACGNVRFFACGSAPLSPAAFATFAARTGHEIVERYGMSETAVNTSNPLDGLRRAGTVGIPLPGVELRIVAEPGAKPGAPGAVHVRGPHVFGGYWRRPEQTAAAIDAEGWFDTGDIGRLDADGVLTLVGRAKELIISGGYNVYPVEVERVLQDIPGVAEAVVIGLPHPDYGEAVTAIMVPLPGAAPDEAAVIAAVKARLAAYKAPKRVLLVPALPRNTIGKVLKLDLQAAHAGLYDAD